MHIISQAAEKKAKRREEALKAAAAGKFTRSTGVAPACAVRWCAQRLETIVNIHGANMFSAAKVAVAAEAAIQILMDEMEKELKGCEREVLLSY